MVAELFPSCAGRASACWSGGDGFHHGAWHAKPRVVLFETADRLKARFEGALIGIQGICDLYIFLETGRKGQGWLNQRKQNVIQGAFLRAFRRSGFGKRTI